MPLTAAVVFIAIMLAAGAAYGFAEWLAHRLFTLFEEKLDLIPALAARPAGTDLLRAD